MWLQEMIKVDLKLNNQMLMAFASFVAGVVIGAICIFVIPPLGEIAASAMSFVSELLVLAGGLLGVNAHFDHKLRQFEAKLSKDEKTEEE